MASGGASVSFATDFDNSAGTATPQQAALVDHGRQCMYLRVIPHEGIGNLVSACFVLAPARPLLEPGTFRRPVVDQSPHLPRTARAGLKEASAVFELWKLCPSIIAVALVLAF